MPQKEKEMVMPYIEGTVTVGGNPITADVEVQGYDLSAPSYWTGFPSNGPDVLDYDVNCPVSLVDGSYTLPNLVFGHSYLILVVSDDGSLEVKATFYGDVPDSGSSMPVPVLGNVSGIDIDCDAGDGTYPSGVTYNAPHDADFVEVMFFDPDLWIAVGGSVGYPDEAYDLGIFAELHANQPYRLAYLAMDDSFQIVVLKFYDNKSWGHYSQADTVLGGDSGLRLNLKSGPITAIPMGSGAHFSIPRRRK